MPGAGLLGVLMASGAAGGAAVLGALMDVSGEAVGGVASAPAAPMLGLWAAAGAVAEVSAVVPVFACWAMAIR
jgi:hypothetical protein